MRRTSLNIVITLITFMLGISFTSGWNSLRKKATPTASALDSEKEPRSADKLSVSSSEEDLLEIYHRYAVAQNDHDVAFFEQIEAEDFVLFRPHDKSLTRTEDIELMKTWDPDIKYTNDDLNVQFYGDAAVVTGRMTATFSRGGGYSWPWIDVCVRRNGRWQILSTTQVN